MTTPNVPLPSPGAKGVTNPQPDLAAYRDFPLHLPFDQVRWQDVSPVLVVEVLSLRDRVQAFVGSGETLVTKG